MEAPEHYNMERLAEFVASARIQLNLGHINHAAYDLDRAAELIPAEFWPADGGDR